MPGRWRVLAEWVDFLISTLILLSHSMWGGVCVCVRVGAGVFLEENSIQLCALLAWTAAAFAVKGILTNTQPSYWLQTQPSF